MDNFGRGKAQIGNLDTTFKLRSQYEGACRTTCMETLRCICETAGLRRLLVAIKQEC